MEYISLCMYTVMHKNYVFIAAILSELHAPWQPVMQCYVIGLTTLKFTLPLSISHKVIFPYPLATRLFLAVEKHPLNNFQGGLQGVGKEVIVCS